MTGRAVRRHPRTSPSIRSANAIAVSQGHDKAVFEEAALSAQTRQLIAIAVAPSLTQHIF
jgi:alkylhydroperoxidase/carboxymuconolactone decarboxylase family protein YurZ